MEISVSGSQHGRRECRASQRRRRKPFLLDAEHIRQYVLMEFPRISSSSDAMCLAHVADPHLLRRLAPFSEQGECSLCPTDGLVLGGPVVNLEHVAELVDWAAERSYNHDGQFFEGEQLLEPMTTEMVVLDLLDGCVASDVVDELGERVTTLITEDRDWFEPYDMDYEAGVEFEWDDFEDSVKHVSRMLMPPVSETAETIPEKNWMFVKSLLVFTSEHAGLIRQLEPTTSLFRARAERDVRELERKARESPESELGPAPKASASAGRMNPQGISMMYAAFEAATACAEVASHSPYSAVVAGEFVLQQQLRVLDLTVPLPTPSVFDDSAPKEGDERLASLGYYVQRITQPVIVDGNHPTDYAPTQVLTDAFRFWSNPRLDGIIYPSRVHKGGKNVVLFYGHSRWYEQVGKSVSRMERYEREIERGSQGPLFVIDPKTVRRYSVDRDITVKQAWPWTEGAEGPVG